MYAIKYLLIAAILFAGITSCSNESAGHSGNKDSLTKDTTGNTTTTQPDDSTVTGK